MKGKLWELGPFAVAVVVGLYFLAAYLSGPALPPAPSPAEAPRAGLAPRASSGPGDPTKPSDFLPDPDSKPDPNSVPDAALSTATAGALPAKR